MTTMTKRVKTQAPITPGKAYAIDEALKLVRDNAKVKFVESVDVAVRLGVDAKKSDQQVRGSTVLPAGTGKSDFLASTPRRTATSTASTNFALLLSLMILRASSIA